MTKKAAQPAQTSAGTEVPGRGLAPTTAPGAPDQPIADTSAPGGPAGESASDAPQTEHAADTASTDTGEPRDSEAGDTAGLAGVRFDASAATEAEFEARYPAFYGAMQNWKAGHVDPPRALKIVAKREGFRRAGMAHSRAGAEHSLGAFGSLEDFEALFAEPNLVVAFV